MSECQEWSKARKKCNGYGVVNVRINGKQKQLLAHRWVWEKKNGPIPKGLCVLHKCDNRACINVDHLFLGTQRDNLEDMTRKGRRRYGVKLGEQNNFARYKTAEVIAIRNLFGVGMTISALQRRFSGCYQAIWAIVHRKSWKHI